MRTAHPEIKLSTAETLNRHQPVPGRLVSVLSATNQTEELGPQSQSWGTGMRATCCLEA